MATIIVKDLVKKFGETTAVNNLSFRIEDGEFLGLLGPSGCGKTTTLRMIAGLEQPTSGSIWFDDKEITNLHPADRGVSMVFQNYALFPHMTVYKNVRYPLVAGKPRLPRSQVDKKVMDTLRTMSIQELRDRLPKQLSGGQQQRVAIARAIIRGTQVYLYDEPLAHLDAKLRARMRGELKRLQRSLRVTSVYVTQDQIEALSMADRIIVMELGEFQQMGTPHQLYLYPKNVFVAGFIGTPEMNFINCVLKKKPAPLLVGDGLKLPISDQLARTIEERATGSDLIVGYRPVDPVVHPRGSSDKYPISGRVFFTEPLGFEEIVEIKVAGGAKIRVVVPGDMELQIDDLVDIEIPPTKFHVFDKTTGLNINIVEHGRTT